MSSVSAENQNPNKPSPLNLSNLWLKKQEVLDHVVFAAIRRRSLSNKRPPTPQPPLDDVAVDSPSSTNTSKTLASDLPQIVVSDDLTSLFSDEILLHILSKLPEKSQRNSNCLVSKRWLNLQGRLVSSLRVFDWDFLISGRMFLRFPNLIHVDLLHGVMVSNTNTTNLRLLINHEFRTFSIAPDEFLFDEHSLLPVDEVDFGLKVLSSVYPNLQTLVVANCSEMGLLSVAEECPTLQELVLHRCNDQVLCGIAAFTNLQTLKLIGVVDGFYSSLVSDRGLTILAQGCKRLAKLELRGCEGGYEGIKAIGQCCQMLEELSFCDHRMDDGWLSALCYCENLKSLKFVSCKRIDRNPDLDEHLGVCPMLTSLHLERCQLRIKQSVRALFYVCQDVQEVVFKNCWGLNDAMFFHANLCRRLKFVSLEGCSRLTTQGLEAMVLSWKELESLKVISCKNIKDDEFTPVLSTLLSALKEFQWRPGNASLQSTSLSGSGMGKRGGKFFK